MQAKSKKRKKSNILKAHQEISRHQSRKKFKYCICNLYMTSFEKYHAGRRRLCGDLHRVLPYVYRMKEDSSIYSALELRSLMKNTTIKSLPIDFFAKEGCMNDDVTYLDAEKVYNRTKLVVFPHDKEIKLRQIPFGKFLRLRGFTGEGRLLLPRDYLVDDPSVLLRGLDSKSVGLTMNLSRSIEKSSFEYEKLCQHNVAFFSSILSEFPDKKRGKILVRNDVYIQDDMCENWFDYITGGLYFDKISKELSVLHKRQGKKTEYFIFTCFLLCLKYGYCDIEGDTNLEFENYVNGFWKKLFGEPFDAWSTKFQDIACCENQKHVIRVYPFDTRGRFRRAILTNSTTDGECCYKYMFKSTFPNRKISST
mmetsp:Transcript_17146/g.19491  ORF Transcript_17146/g.19491 Transcript_17146/m.19491 type:complete len:366 (-) Transcript_17146:71-1168(-)